MNIKDNIPRAIDQDVQELEKLKAPSEGHYESISMMKAHESSYINENGKEKSVAKLKQQLDKNGELLAKLEQKVSFKNDHIGGKPDTRIQLSIDIPSKGIHKQASYGSDDDPPSKDIHKQASYGSNDDPPSKGIHKQALYGFNDDPPRKRDGKYREYDKKNYNSLFPSPSLPYFNVEATPEDMAEYIFFTKDDKSVTQAIEKLIQEEREQENHKRHSCRCNKCII